MTTDTIQLARQKYADGEHKQAHVLLVKAIYDTGLKDELLAELQRLFPADPELLKKLEDYEQRLSATDLKTRQKAAKELSRLALGELSNTTFDFLRHPETMTLLIGQLANSDAVVQENIVITLAMAFQRYTRDMRAFAPLVEKLSSKSVNTRAWAATGLIDLTEESVEHVLPLVADKSERVWKAVTSELTAALDGGGILSQSPIGLRNRRKIRAAMLLADRNRDAEFRITVASLLFRTAEPQDIPAMQLWLKKDGSKFVKQFLKDAIERLQKQPLPPETEAPVLENVAPAPSVTSPSLTSHPTQKKSPLASRKSHILKPCPRKLALRLQRSKPNRNRGHLRKVHGNPKIRNTLHACLSLQPRTVLTVLHSMTSTRRLTRLKNLIEKAEAMTGTQLSTGWSDLKPLN